MLSSLVNSFSIWEQEHGGELGKMDFISSSCQRSFITIVLSNILEP